MCATSFFKRVVNNPRSLCLVVGGVMSGALYLGGVMTVNRHQITLRRSCLNFQVAFLGDNFREFLTQFIKATYFY